ncbi:hypothetical protein [Paenibacillus elgii]|uniref:hypothetical protein n=1 Tax=Paenibacillus elgii TaxID=189691 RepID=UPI00203BDA0E|nr:hypothetical protein [Paenibacillus elgii]MCM3273978.1 hypothetical protein [Paenibacillus elgii]
MSTFVKRLVEKLQELNELPKSSNPIVYCLTHTYDLRPKRFYVEAPYSHDVFEAICAYIQFECSEMEETYSMDQTDVIEILEKFYECKKVKRAKAIKVDLYYNWECFCGSGLQSVECLKRSGMNEFFNKFIKEFYKIREQRK